MRYLIIGLGIYGSNLARDLTSLGHQVIAADIRPSATEAIKDYVSAVYIIDSTDENALDVLPFKNVDLVIVAIGENFGASVRTVALLKKKGTPHIYARAIDELHRSILESFKIDRILTPEQRAASDLCLEMMLGSNVETLPVDEDKMVANFAAPDFFYGVPYNKIGLDKYGLILIAATRPHKQSNILNIDSERLRLLDTNTPGVKVEAGDVLTCIGTRSALLSMMSHLRAGA